jgi:lysophospholipase L1-like esterase
MRWLQRSLVTAGACLLAGGLVQLPAQAATASAHPAASPVPSATSSPHSTPLAGPQAPPGPTRLSSPAKVLPSGWQQSADEAVTVAGDSTGLHVLAANEASGYAWRTVTTLGDPAVETDLWIGQACVTAGGTYAVVVYAPEQATNTAQEQGVLGRAAIVDLHTGAVKELGGGFSIAYFDPGCGAGSQAVLTEGGWANDTGNTAMSTTLVLADAASGKISTTVKVPGQATSAVPYDGQIAVAGGAGLEEVSTSGKTRLLAATTAVPFRLTPAADGSLGYQVMAGKQVGLWQLAGGHARQVASAQAGSVELSQIGGRTWLVGPQASKVAGLPGQWQPLDAPAIAQPSTTGTLAVTDAEPATPVRGQKYNPASAQPAVINAQLLTGKRGTVSFKVATTAAPAAGTAGTAKVVTSAPASRAASSAAGAAAATPGSPSTPVSADRTCAIALDDPAVQAYQPTFKQVEWAADQAVQGTLTDTRPAGLYGSSLSAYTPQGSGGLFPLPAVDGGGHLPAQVLLGVLTQESNLQQASTHVIQGQTSNPLSSFNWYGNWIDGETVDTGLVNWSASDCGYGIGQITSGMCMAGNPNNNNECAGQASTTLTPEQQLAVAVDYQANIAAAAQLLITEWNDLYSLGITPTDGIPNGQYVLDPYKADYIGMWYMAIWAYNSGLEPGSPALGNTTGCSPSNSCTDGDGNWGLGYADNPINPIYPPDRPNFPSASANATPTGTTYTVDWDMSHPEYWPYQEKVNGWAFDSITLWDYSQGKDVQAFAYAPGNSAVATYDTFCVPGAGTATTPGNNCDASGVSYTSPTASDSCQLTGDYADHCWWHWPASVNPTTITHGETPSCVLNLDCGMGVTFYAAGAADPGPEPIAARFAQTCVSALPSNAVIVGDGGQSALGCPGQNWTPQGSFTWNFAADANGHYSSKIYFDQIGAGFGGHFWFGYSQPAATPASTVITGTWNPPSSVSGWTDVKVAIPSYGANAGGALYQVSPGGGEPGKDVQIDQGTTSGANTWVDLGDFDLGSGASVSLSNVTPDFTGLTPASQDLAWSAAAFIPVSGPSWTYTAMGDSYSSGEGNPPYDAGNDGCDRSQAAFGRQFATDTASIGENDMQHIACSGAVIANLTTTGQNGEQPQISQIYTGSKLVTVTMGGNDLGTDSNGGTVGFASILSYCMTNQNTCESYYNSDDGNNLYTMMDDSLKPRLTAAYQAIRARVPDATVIAVTYPQIFQPRSSCLGNAFLPVPDDQFLISVGLYLDNTIIAAAKAAGINVLDERYAFLGHQICSAAPWVYGLDSALTPGEQFLDTSPLFHPTVAGHSQMATDLGAYWQAIQAGGAPTVWPQSLNPNPANGWLPKNLPNGIPTTVQAQAMLNSLPTIANPPTPTADGYSTSAFGTWPGVRNGWTTRNTVLAAQALTTEQEAPADVTVGSGNVVIGGTWQQPYDTTAGAPATPVETECVSPDQPCVSGLPVDHFVPRAYAWVTGADTWLQDYPTAITVTQGTSTVQTTQGGQMLYDFSNDLSGDELLIVGNSSNSAKGDSGPQSWMPQNQGMYCAYAKMWVEVKWQWDLAVATGPVGTVIFPGQTTGLSEKDALQYLLNNYC